LYETEEVEIEDAICKYSFVPGKDIKDKLHLVYYKVLFDRDIAQTY